MNKPLLIFALWSCLNTSSKAQSQPLLKSLIINKNIAALSDSSMIDKTISEIVVTAQRTPSNRFLTAEAISVLSNQQMQAQQVRSSPEALTSLLGVFVQKTNHGGGSPFIRGLTGNQTLQLIDGIRLNNATYRYGPNQYFNTIDPLSIERIEVLRGGGSVQYGSDALGGTIQAFSKMPIFSDSLVVKSDVLGKVVTQRMEETGRAEVGLSSSKIAFLGGVSYHNFGDLVGGDTTGRQTPSGYKELDFDIKSRFRLKENMVLTVAHQNVKQSHVPVFHKIQLENFNINEFEPQKRQLTYARLDFETTNNLFKKIYVITSLQNTEEGRNSKKNGSTTLRIENDRVRSIGLSTNIFSQLTEQWSANSGIEVYSDFVKSIREDIEEVSNLKTAKRGLYPNGSEMTSFSIFSIHTYHTNNWQLTLGGRFNGLSIQVTDETIGKSTLKPSDMVWNASILRGITDYVNVFASAHSSFRAPNIDDLGTLGIVDFRYETPNFNLNPEKSYNFQLGLKFKKENLQGETYLYRNELRNIIARVRVDTQKVQGYPLYQKENIEKGYIQGIETAWKYILTSSFNLELSASYTYGQNLTKNEPMRRIPPLNGRWAVNFNKNHWLGIFEILGATQQSRLAQGDKDDNRIPKGGTPSWYILNLYSGYSFQKGAVYLAFQNLLNRDYRTHGSGINGMGRAASLSFLWRW